MLLSSSSLMNILRRSRRYGAAMAQSVDDIYEDPPQIPGTRTIPPDIPTGVSQEAGLALLMSGEFGRIGPKARSREKDRNISRLLSYPSARFQAAAYKEDISSVRPRENILCCPSLSRSRISCPTQMGMLLPPIMPMFTLGNSLLVCTCDISYAMGHQTTLTADSSLYYTCAQGKTDRLVSCRKPMFTFSSDFRLRVYDTKTPPERSSNEVNDRSHRSTMKVLKTIQGCEGQWTITDSHISPDTQR
jgi:WD repeat-containing protein 23